MPREFGSKIEFPAILQKGAISFYFFGRSVKITTPKVTTIFIVEDDPSLQFLLGLMLEGPEFKILGVASDGEEAVEMFNRFAEKPQIILMDHRMPKKTGLDATREILASSKTPKIIFASADTSIKAAAFSSGAVDFLKKPFNREALIKSIEAALKK